MAKFLILLTVLLVFVRPNKLMADIGTDLDLNAATTDVRLYWAGDNRIFEGVCAAGSPILRDNCSESVRQVDSAKFQNFVLADSKAKLKLAEDEFATPNQNFLVATGRLQDFDTTSQERFQIIGEITQLKQVVADLLLKKSDLSNQLSKIEEELQTNPSDELKAKYHYLQQKMYEVQTQLIAKDKDLKDKNSRLKILEQTLAGFETRDVLLQNIEIAKGPYDLAKAKYDQAKAMADLASDSVAKVINTIVYEILSTNTEFAKNRPWVKNFKDTIDRIQLSFKEGDYSEDYGRSSECIHHLKIVSGTTISISFSGTDRSCKNAGTATLTCTWSRCKGSNEQIKNIELIKLNGPDMYQTNVSYQNGSWSSSTYSSRR